MQILVLNAGSSSIKYKLFEMESNTEIAGGLFDHIGMDNSSLEQHWIEDGSQFSTRVDMNCSGHHEALEVIMEQLQQSKIIASAEQLSAIGHRVVHGGEAFHKPAIIDETTLQNIRDMVPLAPLHNPANIEGIEVARKLLPSVPQIAVFDTAFHQTMPAVAYRYAVPNELYDEKHVRRYGFHGTSHHYVAKQAAKQLEKDLSELNLISLHLGNGCSATAIQKGKSIDTSMGMTPLEGLVMGTRSGDIDPALHFYLQRDAGYTCEEIGVLLNKQSGLKGLCGVSDMRQLQSMADAGNKAAQLAEDIFVYQIKKYLGAYFAILGGLDAVIFTGGIGENSARIREKVCSGLEHMGIGLQADAEIPAIVIPTNEELEIALNTQSLIH